LLDAWALVRSSSLGQFLVMDSADFIELAFLSCLGRSPDPIGQGHYLGRLQQGVPRLEVLAQLAGSQESVEYRGKPTWPFWLRPLLWGLRVPSAFVRRGTRAVLRRIENRVGNRARGASCGLTWRLAGTIDEMHRSHQSDMSTLSQEVGSHAETLAGRLTLVEKDLSAAHSLTESLTGRLTLVESDLAATRSLTENVAGRLTPVESDLAATRSLTENVAGRLAALGASFEASSKALTAVRARMAAADYHASVQPVATAAVPAAIDDVANYYLTLESVFRGDPARIRDQLEVDYLQLLVDARNAAGAGLCVDLGCGRGEWLDVLAAHGFRAQGVDFNAAMAGAAKARGHDVTVGDALAFLRAMPDDSVLACSAFHLAEHLDFSTLFRVVAECRRVLKPQGLLILETPNPENIWVATHTFHHDPTHGQPLTPASLEFLVNHHGLETVAVLRLHPYPDEARLPGNDPVSERLNAMTCGGQDFAVVAKKTPLEE
jgi:O-antigen chain-terminating methyltransferase